MTTIWGSGLNWMKAWMARYASAVMVLTLKAINSSHVAALLTLKANSRDTLTVKQWEIMISNDVLLFSATTEETPYKQLLHYHQQWRDRLFMNGSLTGSWRTFSCKALPNLDFLLISVVFKCSCLNHNGIEIISFAVHKRSDNEIRIQLPIWEMLVREGLVPKGL